MQQCYELTSHISTGSHRGRLELGLRRVILCCDLTSALYKYPTMVTSSSAPLCKNMRCEYIWGALALGICASATQRCTSSQPCWPSSVTWATFNSSIGGRLVAPRPSAWPCHDPHFDLAACADVQANWSNSFWRANQTGAMQDPLWESTGCWIDTPRNTTCNQGLVPTYAVVAKGQEDVVKAVQFASKHKLKVVVKNTGHD